MDYVSVFFRNLRYLILADHTTDIDGVVTKNNSSQDLDSDEDEPPDALNARPHRERNAPYCSAFFAKRGALGL